MNVLEEYKSLMGIVLKNMVEVLPKNLVLTYFIKSSNLTLEKSCILVLILSN